VGVKGGAGRLTEKEHFRTFALIVSAHPYCARKFTPRHASMRALSNKMNNDGADGHWTLGEGSFSLINDFLRLAKK